ncbi:hypothetical protein [Mucilaginibacter sp.]
MKKIIVLFSILMICCMCARSKETSSKLIPSMSYQSYNYNPFGQLRTMKFRIAKPATNALNNVSPYVNPYIKWVQGAKNMSSDSTTVTIVNNIAAAEIWAYRYTEDYYEWGIIFSVVPVDNGGSQTTIFGIVSDPVNYLYVFYMDRSGDQRYQTATFTIDGIDYPTTVETQIFPYDVSYPITITLNPS